MLVDSKDKIIELRSKIYENARETYNRMKQAVSNDSFFELFADIKFNKFGYDPIKGTPLNFIEQINQMFSDLVVLYAVEELLAKYPDKQFEVNFGSRAGFDIQSIDKLVVAECFAVTNVNSNGKLREDAKKLMKISDVVEKFIYFYSQNDSEDNLERIYTSFLGITFIRVKNLIA